MEDGGKSLSDNVHKMPFGRIFGYSNNPPETSKGEELVEEKAKMENNPKKDQKASEKLLNLMLRWLAFLILIPAFQYFSSPSAIIILSILNLVFVFYLFSFPVLEQKDRPSWFLLNDIVNEILVNMSYSGFPGVDGGLLFGLSTFSNMACVFYLMKEEILKDVQKTIDRVSRIFSSNPRNEKTNQGEPENKSSEEDEELLKPKSVVGDEDEELLKPGDQNSATKIWKDKETLTMETSKGKELVEEKAKMENDPKKDQEASENEFSEKLLNLMIRWLAFLILIPTLQYFSSPSAILILSILNIVFGFCLYIFPVEQKDHFWFLLNDVVNVILVNMPYISGAPLDFPIVDGGLLFGLSTFSNMACAFYLIKEEILKSVQETIDRIFSSNPRESNKGEKPMKGKTTIQAELPQDDKDVAEDKANDKWEEEMLEEESSHNGSDSISDSSEDVELMEIDRHGNPSDSSNDELKCLTCEIEARVKMQQEYGDLLDKVHAYEEDSRKWEEEKLELNAKLTAITNRNQLAYESNVDCRVRDIEERSTISAKLVVAIESSKRYKARLLDSEETCHTLKKQNANLSTKLLVETSSVEYLQKRVHEFEEKCRVLEAEKNDLTTKLCTTTASSELYQSLLRNLNC